VLKWGAFGFGLFVSFKWGFPSLFKGTPRAVPDKQQKAFDEIKWYMKEPPVLVPPQLNKPFKLYVAADIQTI
jgi:hypothetical protein